MRVRFEAWLRARPVVVDGALVVLLIGAPVLQLVASGRTTYLLDIALLAPLVLRRVAPVASLATVSLVLLAQLFVTDGPRWSDVALMFGLYAVAAYGPTWARWAGLLTGVLGVVLAMVDWQSEPSGGTGTVAKLATLLAPVLFSWTLGSYMRTRRSYVAELEDRAVRLERDAAQQAQIAAAAERARIAREMHDVVAHSLSVIVVQADGALYASSRRPEAAIETLGTISATGRESLAEMRRLLGLLRGDDGGQPRTTPLPSAVDLPELVDRVRSSGLDVHLRTSGDLSRLGQAAGLTVFRIVQEALTNTLKHGGPDVTATVTVVADDREARVDVEDDGRGSGATSDRTGHGILGIRERIAVHEGTIAAGPRVGGGFAVRATIPIGSDGGRR